MYSNPAPVFIHYLKQLEKMLVKIEAHGSDQANLLQGSLQKDMLPFISQVRTAINFSLRTCCPLVGRERFSFDSEATFAGLREQLQKTVQYLEALTDVDLEKAPLRIQDKAGFNDLDLPCDEYVGLYALPNFFFHLSMSYAIARQAGVPLSKADFDGYHSYPVGFSFV
jgi:uncharacterized protein